MFLPLAFALLVVSQAAQAASADPAEAVAPVAVDVIGALGPTTSAPVTVGATRYLPLVAGGVAIVDVTDAAAPRFVGRMLEGRVVSRLVLVDGQLMAIVVHQEALTFSLADPLAPIAALVPSSGLPHVAEPTTPPRVPLSEPVLSSAPARAPDAVAAARARVLEVTGGRVIFDGGSLAGFTKGSRVRIVSQQLVDKPDLAGSGTTQVASGEVTAVVAVEEAERTRAMAKLGRGDVAFPGDLVELAPTSELSERLFLPRRAPFTVRAGFHARPFLGLGSTSVGFLVDGYASYYFASVPIALTVELAPIGFAVGSQDAHYPMTGAVLASYTTDYFEIGVGGGALLGNPGPCFQTFDPNTGLITGGVTCEVNTGPTINQALRLGSVDGLHIAWSSSIFVRSPEGFVFGMGRAELGVPVSSTLGLFAAGGGGENGWGFGEVGVRSFFGGTGAPGTVMLSASLGGAGVFDGPNHENVIGPSVAFGMEWRL